MFFDKTATNIFVKIRKSINVHSVFVSSSKDVVHSRRAFAFKYVTAAISTLHYDVIGAQWFIYFHLKTTFFKELISFLLEMITDFFTVRRVP